MRAEHLMRLHWAEVVNGPTVTKALTQSVRRTSPRKASLLFQLFCLYLTHSSCAAPPPPPLAARSLQGPSLSQGIYLESCSMSKEIVQLRELFQNISGSQWTSYLFASTTELRPSPLASPPCLSRRPLRVRRRERHILAPVVSSGPSQRRQVSLWCRVAGQSATDLPRGAKF